MAACGMLSKGMDWQDATGITAMGCGANMRIAPIGLHPGLGPRTARDLAQLAAVITHGHPGAVVATALTADAIRAVRQGYSGSALLDLLLGQCEPGMTSYYPHWVLGDLWEQSEYGSPEAYMKAGYQICAAALSKAARALEQGWAGHTDPCSITGQAWTAPEALAGAVLCTAGLWDEPVAVLQRAACSNGDSDSLAAIAGNIRGAAEDVTWPQDWVDVLEVKPKAELYKLAEAL
jgi:ADP-ribosylglycohydrolase